MDQCEQLDVEDDDQPIGGEQLIAGWSSTRRKVESVAEKVAWSSSSIGVVGVDCEKGDSSGNLPIDVTSSVIAATSSKWSSDQKVIESYVDQTTDDGQGGSLIVVHNRSARRLETHTESIVTRKVRSQMIEIEDDGDDDDDENQDEGGFFEEEQLISALSASSIDDQGSKSDSSPMNMDDKSVPSDLNSDQLKSPPISSLIKLCESGSTATLSLTKSCWSSTVTQSIESVDENFIDQTIEDDETIGIKFEMINDEVKNDDDCGGGDGDGGDQDEGDNKLTQQVWSRIEKIRDEYEKSSSSSLLLSSSSSSQAHNHQIWSSIHSESIESTESTEFISANLSSSSAIIDEGKIINKSFDYNQVAAAVDDDDDDGGDEDNSNCNSRNLSRYNSNEDNEDNDDESFESDEEVAISIRRPSLSLVKAEAYVFRSRKSLEELDTEIVIRKKRKPKVNKEMDETATIFIANYDSKLITETSSSSSPPSSSSSSSSSLPLSSKPINENRRDNLIESLTKHGSLDTETDSNEDDEEMISEQFDEQSTNYLDEIDDQLSQLASDRFDWNRCPTTSVFKSDQEINDLF